MSVRNWTINPETGRKIKVGGPTWMRLTYGVKKGTPGSSDIGRYRNVPLHLFAGTVPGTFPINTPGRARAALARAHFDQHPDRVRKLAREALDKYNKLLR